MALIFHFYFLHHYSLLPLGKNTGYPFFYPILPLAKILKSSTHRENNPEFIFIPTLKNLPPQENFQAVFILNHLEQFLRSQQSINTENNSIFIAPESFLPFPIEKHQEQLKLIAQSLQNNHLLIFGCYSKENNLTKQSVCVASQTLIKIFDKNKMVPFYEENEFFCSNKQQSKMLKINNLSFHIFLCFEFFSNLNALSELNNNDRAIVLAQEGWFPIYFEEMMLAYTTWIAFLNQKKIIFCSSSRLRILNFSAKIKL
jgi:hypothetical protein